MQNTAGGLTRGQDHICPVLASLYWSPVCIGTDFRIWLITFKALSFLSSSVIRLKCSILYEPGHNCRSSVMDQLLAPAAGHTTTGDWDFAAKTSQHWSYLSRGLQNLQYLLNKSSKASLQKPFINSSTYLSETQDEKKIWTDSLFKFNYWSKWCPLFFSPSQSVISLI